MIKLTIIRNCYLDKQTQGIFYLYNDNGILLLTGFILELPWHDNKRNISCIPLGEYKAVYHVSPRLGKSYWLQDVPNRSEIILHKGNYHTQINGCLLPGDSLVDIDGDGYLDVTNSVRTLDNIFSLTNRKDITIEIKEYSDI